MRRKLLHITILLSLGLYYNGASALWLAYSTFAKTFFIEHCENPTKPCCAGKCQVKKIEEHSASSNESAVHIQYSSPQPAIVNAFELDPPQRKADLIMVFDQSQPNS